jgi:uncharacterized membrane protein
MTRESEGLIRLERELGRVLLTGVAISAVALAIGIGWLLLVPGSVGANRLLTVGLAVLTATPMLRVVVSIVEYVRMRELVFAGVTLLVLAELAVGVAYALWRG